ncbi:MAG: glycosyltransferase family A protein [Candidatus Acidiferrum sp.]|jgi:glycosyltransferase involved in cell wall biosynthesis
MPRVSAIIPAYNAARFLPTSIESVIRQTYDQWEIVVVDDGSTDDTREVVSSYAHQLGDKLRYVYQPNAGVPAARNTGIRNARGELIALLDADDIWLPSRLERSVVAMDSDPEVGLVHGKFERVSSDGEPIKNLLPTFPTQYLSGKISDQIYTRKIHLGCLTVTFRRSCIEKAGWFDETMLVTEDRDLWFRIALHYKVAFVDEVIAKYRVSSGSLMSDPERSFKWQMFFVEKHYKAGTSGRLKRMQALASIYRERADTLYRQSKTRQAIYFYFRAALFNPFQVATLYMVAKSVGVTFRDLA